MKCQKCGSELRDSAKFCDNCGAAVQEINEKLNEDDHKKDANNKAFNKNAISIFVIFAAAIIIVAVAIGVNKCSVQEPPDSKYPKTYTKELNDSSSEYEKPTYKYLYEDITYESDFTTEKVTEPPTEKETEPKTEKPQIINNTSANGFWAEGNGDYVAKGLNVSGGYAVLHVENYNSKGHFSVITYKNDDYQDLLVNTSESYSGDVLVVGSGEYELKITAKGAWKITSRGLDIDDTTSFSGTGDAVTGITSHGGGNWEITNNGKGHFSVIEYSLSNGYLSLLANTSGDYSGVDKADKGDDIFFKVTSQGSWTIKKQ